MIDYYLLWRSVPGPVGVFVSKSAAKQKNFKQFLTKSAFLRLWFGPGVCFSVAVDFPLCFSTLQVCCSVLDASPHSSYISPDILKHSVPQ